MNAPELPGLDQLGAIWMPVGAPGFTGDDKARRHAALDERFGTDGWRWAWIVRGETVPFERAIAEYEEAYRVYLRRTPELVDWLVSHCGNVYDHSVDNVYDDDYVQPVETANHYQDISVRRVVAELTGASPRDPDAVLEEMVDLGTGQTHLVPRAPGFEGRHLGQIREPHTPLVVLNPAFVPVHDPALMSTLPGRIEWYHSEGSAHLSVEAFWQMSKLIEVRYDRFLALGDLRADPLAGI